jgi:hypothetical protein
MLSDEVNRLILMMGQKLRAEIAKHIRKDPRLLPLPPYSFLSSAHAYLTFPTTIKRILRRKAPEEIAAESRRLGSETSPALIWSIGYYFLIGREILLEHKMLTPASDKEQISLVLDFWRRLSSTHRGDGKYDSSEAGGINPFLPSTSVSNLYRLLVPVDTGIRRTLERFLLTLESYSLLLHGDSRVGLSDSGPYLLSADRVMVVRNYTGLRGNAYPWKEVATDFPYSSCALAFTFDPADFQSLEVSDWAALSTDPPDYAAQIREMALVQVEGRVLTSLPFTQMDWMLHIAQKTSLQLSAWFSQLEPGEQIIEGVKPSAWVLRPLAREVGVEPEMDWDISQEALRFAASLYHAGEERDRQWFLQRFLAPGRTSAFTPLE